MSTVIWQKAASPSCHPSWRRMHSSAACTEQECSPVVAVNALMHRYNGSACPPQVPLPLGIWINIHYTVPWAHTSLSPNSISIGSAIFAPTAHLCAQHTDRHTEHATYDICSNRPHLRTACTPCSLKSNSKI